MRAWRRAPEEGPSMLRRRGAFVALGGVILALITGLAVMTGKSAQTDRAVLDWLFEASSPAVVAVAAAVTSTGSSFFLVPFALCVAGVLAVWRYRDEAIYLLLCTLAGGAVSVGLKILIGRTRPPVTWLEAVWWDSSFPSGHTLNTACVSGALAHCAARIWPRGSAAAAGIAMIWVFAVGLSRLVLGVHWPTDVAGAMGLGLFVTAAASLCVLQPGHLRD